MPTNRIAFQGEPGAYSEEAIYKHPGVAECIVVGVPDAYRGQTVKAFIAPAPGQQLDAQGLREFLKDKLSPIEIPKQFEFRDSLPKTFMELETERLGKPVGVTRERAEQHAADEDVMEVRDQEQAVVQYEVRRRYRQQYSCSSERF